jgi:hypothetical protein
LALELSRLFCRISRHVYVKFSIDTAYDMLY